MQVGEYDGDSMTAMAFGIPSQGTINYISSLVATPTAMLTQTGQQFIDKARQAFETYMESDVLRKAAAINRMVQNRWGTNTIQPLVNVGQLQQAPPIMLPYLMANIRVREEWQAGRVEGYGEDYCDLQPGVVGDQHDDYRRVMNGIAVDTETGWECHTYFSDDDDNMAGLMFEDQLDILQSWRHMEDLLDERGDDPTSRWNSSL